MVAADSSRIGASVVPGRAALGPDSAGWCRTFSGRRSPRRRNTTSWNRSGCGTRGGSKAGSRTATVRRAWGSFPSWPQRNPIPAGCDPWPTRHRLAPTLFVPHRASGPLRAVNSGAQSKGGGITDTTDCHCGRTFVSPESHVCTCGARYEGCGLRGPPDHEPRDRHSPKAGFVAYRPQQYRGDVLRADRQAQRRVIGLEALRPYDVQLAPQFTTLESMTCTNP